ncbi:hypothetical protein [Kitasatospora cheerisanensis]|uniref:Uncharacterized protein n=1 Tax=Kitasatospora cheerisanensis KCTC 2395 TaxID=1348663 RepID=A0A066ZA29_9ACTN|nr:hypothetical protein [Kitasatospora cheerisanensis]KDN87151.1 hypothetical protein KCH_12360 [Kitasatospora cheerisanensis KCTC 2395]
MSADQTPEDKAAETEAVLSLQEAPTAQTEDEVQAHISTASLEQCSNQGTKTRI